VLFANSHLKPNDVNEIDVYYQMFSMSTRKRKLKKASVPPRRTRVVIYHQQARRRLRYSTTFLPHSSLAASLLTPVESTDHKMGTRGVKPL